MTETTAAYEHLVGKAVRVRRYEQPGLADGHPERVLTAEHRGTVTRLLPHDVIELRVSDSPGGPGLVRVGLGYAYLGTGSQDDRGQYHYLVTEVVPLAELASDVPAEVPPGGAELAEDALDLLAGVQAQVARLLRILELLNAYGQAMVGDQWWPGNASVWLTDGRGAELERLLNG